VHFFIQAKVHNFLLFIWTEILKEKVFHDDNKKKHLKDFLFITQKKMLKVLRSAQ